MVGDGGPLGVQQACQLLRGAQQTGASECCCGFAARCGQAGTLADTASSFTFVLTALMGARVLFSHWSLVPASAYCTPLSCLESKQCMLLTQATTRLRQNTLYFRVNYLIIVVAVTAVCMVLSPSSLAVLGVLALLWIYIFIVRKDPLVLGGRTFR